MASRDPAKETIASMVSRMVVLVEEKGDTLTPANTLRHAGVMPGYAGEDCMRRIKGSSIPVSL